MAGIGICPRCGDTVALDDDAVVCSVYGIVTRHPGCADVPEDLTAA